MEPQTHLGTCFPHSHPQKKHQKAFRKIESDSSFICILRDITDLNCSLKAFLTVCQGKAHCSPPLRSRLLRRLTFCILAGNFDGSFCFMLHCKHEKGPLSKFSKSWKQHFSFPMRIWKRSTTANIPTVYKHFIGKQKYYQEVVEHTGKYNDLTGEMFLLRDCSFEAQVSSISHIYINSISDVSPRQIRDDC